MKDADFKTWIKGMRDNPETIGKGTTLLDYVERLRDALEKIECGWHKHPEWVAHTTLYECEGKE